MLSALDMLAIAFTLVAVVLCGLVWGAVWVVGNTKGRK